MIPAQRLLRRLLVLPLVVAAIALGVAEASADTKPARYVALGDSFTSGPLIPLQRLNPLGCARSTNNYPSLLARALRPASFTDISCGAATTEHMTQSQSVSLGVNPPQFSALTKNATLVTVQIGGNDIGFGEIVQRCTTLGLTNPLGAPCRDYYNRTGTDELAARIAATAPKIASVLSGIRQRSPKAEIVVVGYLRILPPMGGCWPIVPVTTGDVPYLDSVQRKLNEMLEQQAKAHRARFVDTYRLGHDACQLPHRKWVEGLVPTAPAAPLHPNASGMRAVASMLLRELTSSVQ